MKKAESGGVLLWVIVVNKIFAVAEEAYSGETIYGGLLS
jgi:hypothetical protein